MTALQGLQKCGAMLAFQSIATKAVVCALPSRPPRLAGCELYKKPRQVSIECSRKQVSVLTGFRTFARSYIGTFARKLPVGWAWFSGLCVIAYMLTAVKLAWHSFWRMEVERQSVAEVCSM